MPDRTPSAAQPHEFVGRLDRWCEVCNRPDRDPIHKHSESSASQGPAIPPDPNAKRHTLAQLRQMTWEATQWLSYDEVREYVESVLREVKSDEP